MSKPVFNISPFTLLDFPDTTACIIWFAGCNMRCLYCYNPEIVLGKGKMSITSAIAFLQSRKGLLNGVVFSGGECLLHPEAITMAKEAKKMGYRIKIDTNGSLPQQIKKLVEQKLIDYIALDFKAPKEKFCKITQANTFKQFEESLNYLIKSKFPFEIRTTWHSALLSQKDYDSMLDFLTQLGYQGTYYIQSYLKTSETLGIITGHHLIQDLKIWGTNNIKVILRN